jgi:RNA polymerase sigma factor (sigma-70 family)
MTSDDMAVVREYAQSNSEQAFATLVSRHVNLVHSVALRQVHDPDLAEEITQAVFIILARKAKSLSPKTILSGWLCRTARYVSGRALRTERRRKFREQEAYMQSSLDDSAGDAWTQLAPHLDEALSCLGHKEHDAVVLRFFDGKGLKQVGAAMGTGEDAARMRVSRGVEKLRKFFAKRGITLSAATLAGAVSTHSVQAAPAGLAKAVTALAIAKGTAASGSVLALVKGALKIMAWKNTQTAVVSIGLLLAAGGGTLIVMNSPASQPAARSTNLELFKKQISTPGISYDVEFVEGDIQHDPTVSVTNRFGRPTISQSQRHYQATLQSNAFLLLQKHEMVAIDEGRKSVDLFEDTGQYDTKGWVRRDSAFIRLVDLNITSTDPTVQSVAEQVKRGENKVHCACFFGLPNFDVSTIKWDTNRFYAKTPSGFDLDGEVSIDPDSGLVSSATYRLHGTTMERGDVSYSYSTKKDPTSLPDTIIKHVEQVPDPVHAALNSFNIKILKYNQTPSICDSDVFMSPVRKSIYVISNGIPITNRRRE